MSPPSDWICGGVFFRMSFLVGGPSGVESSCGVTIAWLSGERAPRLTPREVGIDDAVLSNEFGLNNPRSDDVLDEDAEVGLPIFRDPVTMGETDLRFRGTILLDDPVSESKSERLPDLICLPRASDGNRDESDDWELCIECPWVRKTSAHCPCSDAELPFGSVRLVDGGLVINDEEFNSKGRGPDFAAGKGLAARVNDAKDARIF